MVIQYFSLALWVGMAVYLTVPLVRAFQPRHKSLDMLWAAAWPLAVNRCAFIITSTFLARAEAALFICYLLSIVAGLVFIAVIHNYRKHDA